MCTFLRSQAERQLQIHQAHPHHLACHLIYRQTVTLITQYTHKMTMKTASFMTQNQNLFQMTNTTKAV